MGIAGISGAFRALVHDAGTSMRGAAVASRYIGSIDQTAGRAWARIAALGSAAGLGALVLAGCSDTNRPPVDLSEPDGPSVTAVPPGSEGPSVTVSPPGPTDTVVPPGPEITVVPLPPGEPPLDVSDPEGPSVTVVPPGPSVTVVIPTPTSRPTHGAPTDN